MNTVYGRLMLDIEGISLSDEDKFLIENKHVGGLIFFSRNFNCFEQIKDLIEQIQNIKENIIIAVDQEGGRVQRFNKDFTKIPPMQKVSEYAKNNKDNLFLKEVGWLISSELIAAGIDINFAPVLDLDKNTSSVIGDRAFADNAEDVILLASNFIDGMYEAGMKSTGKHFPGHGGIYEDSHKEMAIDNRTLEELFELDIKPYIELLRKLDGVMCAHVLYPQVDNNIPSFSTRWIEGVLKKEIQYDGVIFSDDLSMLGAGDESYISKAIKSINAGCDMILCCNNRKETINIINAFEENGVSLSSKIYKLKKNLKTNWNDLKANKRRLTIRNKLQNIGS
ncbi:MAG: beta-N-acetylhexosaminidase [Gammaproteobacteria bacterium]